ncbi:hypothetical protein [Winogradskyella sp.]|uniref:hypothetical protein n=1 Tax=Winogradskyella sp. TaxID=1883156 RepID=UPI003F6B376F
MKTSKFIFVFVLVIISFGCEDPLNCIIPKEPELKTNGFPVGSTTSYYYAEIKAEIRNEPRDNDYDYYFDVSELPLGMDYYVNYRTLSIEGNPLEAGTYRVMVYLDVDGPFRNNFNEEPDILCDYSTSKTYTIIIE